MSTGSGTLWAKGSFCLAVQVGDVSYLSRYVRLSRSAYDPSELNVGAEIRVRVIGGNLYLEKPNGGELQTIITRRQQLTADTKPATCAPAVQQ